MDFNLDEGLYVFEVTLGYRAGDDEHVTTPFVLKADDAEEADEVVMEYLGVLNLADNFWIADISGPYEPEEYEKLVDNGETERWDRLEDYSEEDFREILHDADL